MVDLVCGFELWCKLCGVVVLLGFVMVILCRLIWGWLL